MSTTKNAIKDISQLCEKMSVGRTNGTITTNTYSKTFKPYLEEFKEKYNISPNLFLQKRLKEFYDSNSKELTPKVLCKNFGYWGRSIYNYTWSCLFFDFEKEEIPASYSPQLYILVNKLGIKFGFCYGLYITDSDKVVTSATNSKNIQLLKKCLSQDDELCFFNSSENTVTASPEILFDRNQRILIKSDNDIINNWSHRSLLIKEYPIESIPDNIDEIIQNTLGALKDFYVSVLDINKRETDEDVLKLESLESDIKLCNLQFSHQTILRFTFSLITKPFIILTGLSGSGKTKLAQVFAMWLSENDSQYRLVPVGADWTNREPLLGFPNALVPQKYVKPDNGVLNLIINAGKNKDKPYFLILDEMNLSHVERYFADFLSTMESNEKIFLHDGESDWDGVPPGITLPKNLFIIGTVNIDETTYMFSPKVLDRANTIEFRVTKEEMDTFLNNPGNVSLDALKGKGAGFGKSFVNIATTTITPLSKNEEINNALIHFFSQLKISGAEFGYRTASEIQRFAEIVHLLSPETKTEEIIDYAILQKLLPKVHGSTRKLGPVLVELIRLCLEDGIEIKDYITGKMQVDTKITTNIKYPLSLEKIVRMYNNLLNNGFTSFAEA